MSKIPDPANLDIRFRAVEVVPDPTDPEPVEDTNAVNHLHPLGKFHRAIVLLAPGAQLPFELTNVVQLLDDTFIVEAELNTLSELAGQKEVVYIEAPRPADIDLDDSVAATKADTNWPPALRPLTGKGVIVGVVDEGLDFTLDDFKDSGNSRLLYLWDQKLSPSRHGEHHPSGYTYGVEYDRAQITAALSKKSPFSYVRHVVPDSSHGTHVAGIAAGNGQSGAPSVKYKGIAYEADIVFVNYAKQGPLTSSERVAEAIKYVFDKARDKGLPAVVNVSLGHNGGPHDGESVVERAIDRYLERKGRALVKSAGNEGEWQTHASGKIAAEEGASAKLVWVFGGGLQGRPPGLDGTPNTLEVWYSSRDRLRVSVVDPSGDRSPDVDPGYTDTVALPSGDTVHIVSERFHPLNGLARIMVRVGHPGGTLTSGEWLVELTAIDPVVDGTFDAWIERDARKPHNHYADQSFFKDPDFAKTISPPGTIRRGVAVANYDHRASPPAMAKSSSHGPTADGRPKPEIAAPGTNIVSSNANRGGSTTRPFYVTKTGTSMSAPHVSGIIAQLFQYNGTLTAAQIRAVLIASARQPGMGGATAFDQQWGYGAVDAEQALLLLL
jgi:subtilisin family serine protease